MNATNGKRVLIVGASIAGLSSAYWMSELGYEVSVVEIADGIRTGGTAVNIGGRTIDIARRMGILEGIENNRLDLRQWDMKNAEDHTERRLVIREEGAPPPDDDYEIQRDVLLNLLSANVEDRVPITFGESVVQLDDHADCVDVLFKSGRREAFDLVLGCDGTHSGVRSLCFGPEAQFIYFMEQYFSISIVDKLLIPRDTAQMFNVPGKAVMLNAYKNKTDVIFGFVSEQEISYDRRNEAGQRAIIEQEFADVGWRTADLLKEVSAATNFYFDKLCQVRMPAWHKGRVVLVGDAAYCASPAAGMGGSFAIDGAAALADALRAAHGDHDLGFRHYDREFRPYVEEIQTNAVRFGLETLVPRTEDAIRARNSRTDGGF